ncbi:MAG: hypothetical protein ACOC7U_08075 [Spirochaetota bacterium]
MENKLNLLSSKEGFNTALRHFKTVTGYLSQIADGTNPADLINQSLQSGEIQRYQVKSILNALVVDKFNYAFQSHNLKENVENPEEVVRVVSQWGSLHLMVAYYHPQAGVYVINPKKRSSWEEIIPLLKDELMVVYSGPAGDGLESRILQQSIHDFLALLYGNKPKPVKEYRGSAEAPAKTEEKSYAQAEHKPQAAVRRVTPRYSVQVTNELFHNGNVEAWKKIVESYKAKHPDLDVLIWYENERINDINALFKWGKVKHGGLIFFSVAGENIKDVSKLQRYLFEGASPRFEVFLKAGVGRVLDLF